MSAKTQRLERIELIKEMAKMEVQKQVDLFLYEKKKYDLNKECEDRLLIAHRKLNPAEIKQEVNNTEATAITSLTFTDILALLTIEHFGKDERKGNTSGRPTKPQISAFVQVRQPIDKFKGRYPQYKKMHSERKRIVQECMRVCNLPLLKRIFEDPRAVVDNH